MKKAILNTIELSKINVVSNTRKVFDENSLIELTASIKEKGVLQPLGVLQEKDNKFRLIYGERRFRACLENKKEAKKFTSVPCLVYSDLSENEILELQITENLQRKDIHPIEEAEAFKALIEAKKMAVKEIAVRVGKSIPFVAQRLKLNDLIDDFKLACFQNRMSLGDALSVAVLSKESQTMYWESEFKDLDMDEAIEVSNWDIKSYLNDLKNAPFNIKSKTLIPNVGACTNCQFNTACQNSLFPDEEKKANCTNTVCFNEKSKASFNAEIKEVLANPSIELVFKSYGEPSKETKELMATGQKVYTSNEIEVIYTPIEPILADYEARLKDEDFDDEEEMKERYNEDLEEYKADLVKYNDLLSAGKILKGYIIEGNNKGTYIDFAIQSAKTTFVKVSAKQLTEKIKNEVVTADDYNAEINRLKAKEVRNKEIDEEKAQPLFYDVLKGDVLFNNSTEPLMKEEKIAMIFVLLKSGGYSLARKFETTDYDVLMNLELEELDKLTAKISRALLLLELRPNLQDRPSNSDMATVLLDILNVYRPVEKEKIWNAQLEFRTKRETKLNDTIQSLTKKIDDLEKKSIAA